MMKRPLNKIKYELNQTFYLKESEYFLLTETLDRETEILKNNDVLFFFFTLICNKQQQIRFFFT